MKPVLLLFAFLAASAFAAVDLNAPIHELKLSDGQVLKNVTFVYYATTAVVAKWDGGRGTISYDSLPAEVQSAIKRLRPTASKAPPEATIAPLPPESPNTKRISGQMFVTELGGGVFRFADASVVAYPLSSLDALKQLQKQNLSPAQRNAVPGQFERDRSIS